MTVTNWKFDFEANVGKVKILVEPRMCFGPQLEELKFLWGGGTSLTRSKSRTKIIRKLKPKWDILTYLSLEFF